MAAITSAALAIGTAAYSIYNAEEQKKDTKDAIDSFESQDLENPYNNIKISTLKAEQQTQANLSNFATSVDALQRGGTRAVLSGLPRVNEANIALQNNISADIQQQDVQREVLIAKGEAEIRNIREGRENLALQGLGQQYQTARQDSANGLTNLVSGALAIGGAVNNRAINENNRAINANNNNSVSNTNTGVIDPNNAPNNPNSVFNTNGNIIGSNFIQQPAFTREPKFIDSNYQSFINPSYQYNNTGIFGSNPLIFGS